MEILNKQIQPSKLHSGIIIKPIGDIHLGSINCDKQYLHRMLDYINKTPNVYMLGMGDYADCIYGSDKRFDMESMDLDYKTPEDQQHALYRLFLPLAKKGKILGLLTGNHEDKIRKLSGIDITRGLCNQLGIPYLGMSAYVCLSFIGRESGERRHRNQIQIYCHHGYFGGREKASKVASLMKLSRVYEADAYLVGHCHDLFSTIEDRILVANGHIQKRRVVYGLTGTFMKTAEEGTRSYSEDAGYFPTKVGTLSLKLYPTETPVGLHVSS